MTAFFMLLFKGGELQFVSLRVRILMHDDKVQGGITVKCF